MIGLSFSILCKSACLWIWITTDFLKESDKILCSKEQLIKCVIGDNSKCLNYFKMLCKSELLTFTLWNSDRTSTSVNGNKNNVCISTKMSIRGIHMRYSFGQGTWSVIVESVGNLWGSLTTVSLCSHSLEVLSVIRSINNVPSGRNQNNNLVMFTKLLWAFLFLL